MNARLLLDDFVRRGIHVQPRGDRLVVEPASTLTDDDRALLRRLKADLLVLLAAAETPDLSEARDLRAAWRGAARELSELAGYPHMPFKPGISVGPGAANWGSFIARGSVPDLRLAVAALRDFIAAMPHPETPHE